MIKKLETQDQYGNKIYRYTSSDIVLDIDTGHTVKQDIDNIFNALGMSTAGGGTPTEIAIDAKTLEGHAASYFVANDVYSAFTKAVDGKIALRAPLDSPAFTGTPTVPSVDLNDGTEKVANTKYVDDSITALHNTITNTLKSYAASTHSHTADQVLSGTFGSTNVKAKDGTDYTAMRIRNAKLMGETDDLPSSLENGAFILVYEG